MSGLRRVGDRVAALDAERRTVAATVAHDTRGDRRRAEAHPWAPRLIDLTILINQERRKAAA